jgi:Ca2+-transporting ATPase
MATVGHDKRLSYYQQSGDEVIAELRSHRYGLTNPEAGRRLEQNGGNVLPYGLPHSPLHDVLDQAKSWSFAVLLVGVGLSLWQQNTTLTISFLSLAVLVLVIGAWRERHVGALLHNLDTLLPRRVTVRRNGVDSVVAAHAVVVGDMLVLSPGMVVAADIRLLETSALLLDDSALHGDHAHVHKYSHALTSVAPLGKRHNMAFAGTTVVSGSGVGVVVAIGAQTEIGRQLSLVQAISQKQSLFATRLARHSGHIGFALVLLAVGLTIVMATADLGLYLTQTFALTLTAALLPVGSLFGLSLMFATSSVRARHSGVRFQTPSVIDRLGRINIALLDDLDFMISPSPTIQQFLIGKQRHDVTGEGYDPAGHVLGRTKKPLGKKTTEEMSLFFEAAILSNTAQLVEPNADQASWQVTGTSRGGALLALAAKAGFESQAVRAKHQLLQHFSYDHHRQLGSALYEYDHRLMVFVQGDAAAVLQQTSHIWDGGHTRKLAAADISRLTTYITEQTGSGNQVIALAYRKFTAKQQADNLDAQTVEQDLTLLGVVALGYPLHHEVIQATQTLQHDSVAVSLLTDQSPLVVPAIAKQLGLTKPSLVDTLSMAKLDDSQIYELVSKGNSIFSHLTSEQRLRLVAIAQRSDRNVLITGRSLRDVPALHHAAVSVVSATAPAYVGDEADIILLRNDLHDLTHSLNRSRHFITNSGNALQAAFTDNLALVLLALVGIGLYLSQHVPLALTPMMTLALLVLLQPLLVSALDADTLNTKPAATSLDSIGSRVFLSLVAALLATAAFLFFFVRAGLSPSYIDSGSDLYLRAATVSLVCLALFQWINLLFIRANHTRRLTSPKLWHNHNILWTFGISLLLLGNVVYNPLLQHHIGTKPLTIGDWISIVVIAGMYTVIRWFVRSERRHTRHAIIELHQKVHGPNAAPKI